MYLFNKKPTAIHDIKPPGAPTLVYGDPRGPHVVVSAHEKTGMVLSFVDTKGSGITMRSIRLERALNRLRLGIETMFPDAVQAFRDAESEVTATDMLRAAVRYEALEESLAQRPAAVPPPVEDPNARVPPATIPAAAKRLEESLLSAPEDVSAEDAETATWVEAYVVGMPHPLPRHTVDMALRVFEAPAFASQRTLRLAQWKVCEAFRSLGKDAIRSGGYPTLREYVEAVYSWHGYAFPAQSVSVDTEFTGHTFRVLARRGGPSSTFDIVLYDNTLSVPLWWPTYVELHALEGESVIRAAERTALSLLEKQIVGERGAS